MHSFQIQGCFHFTTLTKGCQFYLLHILILDEFLGLSLVIGRQTNTLRKCFQPYLDSTWDQRMHLHASVRLWVKIINLLCSVE